MPVLSGFGLNYKALQANWNVDAAYFKSIGLNNIRPHLSPVPITWSAGTPSPTGSQANVYAYWRLCAQTFANAGFWVTSGPAGPQGLGCLSQALWSGYETAVLAEAAYLVGQGITFGTFTIGNEMSNKRYIQITSLTQTGGTATCVTNGAHNFTNGQTATIYGTNPSGYSGSFTITVVNSNTFTYSCSSSLASPATSIGTLSNGNGYYGYIYDMTSTQYMTNVQTLAAQVKAVSGWTMPVSIDEWNYPDLVSGNKVYSDYISNGLGNLDLISIHPYGNVQSNGTVATGGYAYVQEMITAFGNSCYISEFHVDAGSQNLEKFSPDAQAKQIASFLSTYVTGNNLSKFLVYSYVGYENTDNQFAMQNTDGTFNPMWWQFFQ